MQGFYLNERSSDYIRNPPKTIIVTGSTQLSLCSVNMVKKRLEKPKATVTFPWEAKLSKAVFSYTTSKPSHQITNSRVTYFSCNVGFLLNFVVFTLDLYPRDDCHMLFAVQMFLSNISIKTFFRYKENYFRLGNSENSRFKLKVSLDFGIGLHVSHL